MPRRRGRPGIAGTMARTAVIAGTATAVSGGMQRRSASKQAAKQEQAYANQAAYESQAQLDEMQSQMNAMQAQQAPAPQPAVAAAPAAPAADDVMGQLQRLADMKTAGLLTDAEFAAAKAKLLS
ncbi:MAG: SHOCT domain-containing protein [Actinomycetota bacterium]|nr:SHOCT domain-containing protein [Actinomycetota bacterium]